MVMWFRKSLSFHLVDSGVWQRHFFEMLWASCYCLISPVSSPSSTSGTGSPSSRLMPTARIQILCCVGTSPIWMISGQWQTRELKRWQTNMGESILKLGCCCTASNKTDDTMHMTDAGIFDMICLRLISLLVLILLSIKKRLLKTWVHAGLCFDVLSCWLAIQKKKKYFMADFTWSFFLHSLPYFETSAATGHNVNKAVECLLNLVMQRMEQSVDQSHSAKGKDTTRLGQELDEAGEDKNKCSCWSPAYRQWKQSGSNSIQKIGCVWSKKKCLTDSYILKLTDS